MVDLEDLKFFQKGRKIDEILSGFGNITGSNILKELLEEGFIDKEGEHFKLNNNGKRKLEKISPEGNETNKTNKTLKVFLCYSHSDYEMVNQLKFFLESFGMDVFLAHTSIEPTKEWEGEIYQYLKNCDIFVPILTNSFKESKWTDQECGIAYNERKKIIPLMIDLVPYGFIGKFQAMRTDISRWNFKDNDSRVNMIDLINKEFPTRFRECILNSLEKTSSWIIGKTKFRILKEKEPFSKEEINKIMKESVDNNQIYNAEGVQEYLLELIKKYENKIEPNLKERINGMIENDRAREILGGETEGGFPILYGNAKQKFKQLEGYGGKDIEEMREKLRKEVEEEEKKPSLVDGLKKHL